VQLNADTDKWEMVSEATRRERYLDLLAGSAADLLPIVTSCLNDNPIRRPTATQVSLEIKRLRHSCSQMTGWDGINRIAWLAEVSASTSHSSQQVC